MDTHYILVIVGCGVLSLVLGALWYGPLFGKMWMQITGCTDADIEKRKEMQKKAMPLYFIQFLLVLGQLYVLSHLTGSTGLVGIKSSLWIWGGFVMPTVAGSCMWNNDSRQVAWTRFVLQAGFQLVCFVVFGFILGTWL